jgi:hypothetical protein
MGHGTTSKTSLFKVKMCEVSEKYVDNLDRLPTLLLESHYHEGLCKMLLDAGDRELVESSAYVGWISSRYFHARPADHCLHFS